MDKTQPSSAFFETYTNDELNNFRKKIHVLLKENSEITDKREYSIANFDFDKRDKTNKSNNLSIKTNKESKNTESIELSNKLRFNIDRDKIKNFSKSPIISKKDIFKNDTVAMNIETNNNHDTNNNHNNYYKINFAQLNLKENENIDKILKEKILNMGEKQGI